jgi:hypothetical protein
VSFESQKAFHIHVGAILGYILSFEGNISVHKKENFQAIPPLPGLKFNLSPSMNIHGPEFKPI